MKNLKRLMAVLCAVALVFGTVTLPTFAATTKTEGATTIFEEDFDESPYAAFTKFSNSEKDPSATLMTDRDSNYIKIYTGMGSDSSFGYYALDTLITTGKYRIAFDYKSMTGEYSAKGAAIALANKANVEGGSSTRWRQFKILNYNSDAQITVGGDFDGGLINGTAVSGSLECLATDTTNWYHYEMELEKTETGGTYSVEITKEGDTEGAKATLSNQTLDTNINGMDWDVLMFGNCMDVCVDNILIEKISDAEVASPTDPSVLLKVDYDINNPDAEILDKTNTASLGMLSSGEDKYCTFTPSWGSIGYSLQKAISSVDKEYKIEFDFSFPDAGDLSDYYIVALSNKDRDSTGSQSKVYYNFGLLKAKEISNGIATLMVGGETILTDIFDVGDWYTYELVFNAKTRAYSLTIAQKNNSGRKVESSGIFKEANTYGNGIPVGFDLDAFKFVGCGDISVDNISVAECTDKYIAVNVSSDKVGNIFGGDDAKTVKVGVENLLNDSVSADISYIVKNEKGNTVDSGSIDNISMDARETQEYSETLNLPKYGVYEMYVTVDVNNGEYTYTNKFDLSVINRNDSLNSKFAVNTLRPTSQTAWDDMETVMLQAGLSGMRTDLLWTEINAGTETSYTEYYDDAQAGGIENLVILNCTNPDGTKPHEVGTEDAWDAWENYVTAVATSYGSVIDVYEIINEFNVYTGMNDADDGPTAYKEYLTRANTIINSLDPTAKVAGVSSSGVSESWIKSILNKTKDFDVITVHPYDFAAEDSGYRNSMGSSQPWSIIISDSNVLTDINTVKSAMTAKSYNGELWLTEIGISSTPGITSLSAQGREIGQLCATLDASGVEKTYLYCLENTQSRADLDAHELNAEYNFGLVGNRYDTVSYAAKPAYVAIAGYNKMMNGATYVDTLENNIYLFSNPDGEQTIVLWGDDTSTDIALNLGVGTVEIFDKYSNTLGTMSAASGIYSFTATAEPIFIKGSFSNPQITATLITASNGRIEAGVGDEREITLSGLDTGYAIEANTSSGIEIINTPTATNGSGSIQFKVIGGERTEESIEIKVYDDLDNLVYYTDAQIHIESIKMKEVQIDGSKINFYSQIINGESKIKIAAENTGTDKQLQLITAYYDNDDVLSSVQLTDVTIPGRGLGTYDISLTAPSEDCAKVKIFAWNDLLTPYCAELRFIK